MTEDEWFRCADPVKMRVLLFGPIDTWTDTVTYSTKNVLFIDACLLRLWYLHLWELRQQSDRAEPAMESKYDARFLGQEGKNAEPFLQWLRVERRREKETCGRLRALEVLWSCDDSPITAWIRDPTDAFLKGAQLEQMEQSILLRDIFGNPFRPVAFDPSWRTSTVMAVAAGIYDERAFDRLPILADALQDAECDSDDILNHLRQSGEHVRGCWALDLVLGKE